MEEYRERYERWLSSEAVDEATKEELRAIAGDEGEIKERFYKDLEFGTAGLRGVIGAGTNRLNIYTVRKATQGLANYICKNNGQDKGVAIAYDSRRMSPEFADEAALCLAANGIKAYVFESLRPTPELSYAVRSLGCIAGINITASHNPPEYNGYKVYWEDGAQITPPHDKGIMDEVRAVTDYNTVKTMDLARAKAAGLYQTIGAEVDDGYISELKKQVIHQDAIDAVGSELKIVYSPLHGTGNIPAIREYELLKRHLPITRIDFQAIEPDNLMAVQPNEAGYQPGKRRRIDAVIDIDKHDITAFGIIQSQITGTSRSCLTPMIHAHILCLRLPFL